MKQGLVASLRGRVRLRTRLRHLLSGTPRIPERSSLGPQHLPVTSEEILGVLKYRKYVSPRTENRTIDAFHKLYYDSKSFGQTWGATFWMGTLVLKCPLDMWIYQELLHELKPDLIIETGTANGGSALYMAQICDILGKGEVVTIDIGAGDNRPTHPRITYLIGSSTADAIVDQVSAVARQKTTVMVILDSDHSKDHVSRELAIYSDFVTPGSYLIVEDTNVNGHPVYPAHGPGPMEAVDAFLKSDRRYEVDRAREKFLLTFNPRGYLRRRPGLPPG